ncbi:iron complex transport system substrate-binding protein [Murinocardiopsis flavida]|uniref:Iron complex transport system substrate-binding protein n=1 Tax=Murinocardiopsis flavida TaxID=645275 RepID=A0A2P8DDY9_9ACTN|nr:iron-siderophore ABC transporter substrate-binding protein [Murinocardiopsis flavida]PSK95377.1 iron complex transport system substrate-binding protein [Murinocardiopsis flavida]
MRKGPIAAPQATQHRPWAAAVLSALVAAALTGCGVPDDDAGGSKAGDPAVAEDGARFSTSDKETARLGSDAEPGAFPRTVEHASGSTEITEKPSRVVVLDTGELDDVLSLGVTPVGMAESDSPEGAPPYLADRLSDVEVVGGINDLNVEAIAALKPDLIVGSELRAARLYDTLSEIAPTVFSIRPGFPWKENFLLVGDALGAEKKALDVLNTYQERADEVRESVSGDPEISLVRFLPGKIRLYADLSFIGVILDDAGLRRPKVQDVEELAVEVSQEDIDKGDADWIFYSSYGPRDSTDEAAVTKGGLWKSLDAVQDDKAVAVDDEVWFLGLGPTGAMLVLDDLEEKLGTS